MKKIGFVNFDMSTRGGAQQVLHNIANVLCREYEVHIISMIHEKNECAYLLQDEISYHVILPGKHRIREVLQQGGKKFRACCREENLDLVFYVGAYAGLCGGLLGRTLNISKVFCDHGALMNQWNEVPARVMRTVGSHFSDRTVVLTKQSEAAYYEKFRYRQGRICTIYNWMDDVILDHAGDYDADSRCILTAGRFSPEKGMDLLVDVAAKLRKRTEDFTWEVYGDGDQFSEIAERIEQEGLAGHVCLKGLTDKMETCYRGHCMYVLTSYREGLPLVLLEAKANHLPLISFDIVSGPGEIITDGKDGVLIPPYDTEQMAEIIYRLLENRAERIRMSENTSLRMESFQKEKILNQWRALIEEM